MVGLAGAIKDQHYAKGEKIIEKVRLRLGLSLQLSARIGRGFVLPDWLDFAYIYLCISLLSLLRDKKPRLPFILVRKGQVQIKDAKGNKRVVERGWIFWRRNAHN